MQSMYSTAPADWSTLVAWVLHLWRDAVGVFYSSSRLVYTRCRSLTPLKRCSQCILQLQPIGPHSLRESYTSEEMQSMYSTAPADWSTLVAGVLHLCRDAVNVFYSSSRLVHTRCGSLTPLQRCSQCILQLQPIGPHSLRESYTYEEMQSVYSTAPADWSTLVAGVLHLWRDAVNVFYSSSRLVHTRCGSLTPLKRCSQCILQLQPIGPHSLRESYTSAEMQSMYSTAPADWSTLVAGVLHLCRDAVNVFYSSSRLVHTRCVSLTPMKRCSRCILQLQPIGLHSLQSLTPLKRCSQCILQLQPIGPHSLRESYTSTVGLLYSFSRLGHTRWGSPISLLSVYCTVPVDWVTHAGGVLSLSRDTVGVFQSEMRNSQKNIGCVQRSLF